MADLLDNGVKPILGEQHDDAVSFTMGASHFNASRATDLGLVYDVDARDDYASYICGLLGEKALKSITLDPRSTCSKVGSILEVVAQLSYHNGATQGYA
ncbi:hypothetical protein U9M48_005079 [Paspalum notatum var. saurae]|uniref:Uncharacterized protein n=1 Tax=Paspalum notatum var. saurae TaxID=547442 RepID=A0AAQ3PL29_PASNO